MNFGKPRTINKNDEWVSKYIETNKEISIKANVPTKILEMTPDSEEAFAMMDKTPWLLKLRTIEKQEISQASKFSLALSIKNQMLKEQLTQDISYRPFYTIPEHEQGNTEYINNLRVALGKNGNACDLLFEQLETMIIYLVSPFDCTLSWNESIIEIPGVELTMDEAKILGIENTPSLHYR